MVQKKNPVYPNSRAPKCLIGILTRYLCSVGGCGIPLADHNHAVVKVGGEVEDEDCPGKGGAKCWPTKQDCDDVWPNHCVSPKASEKY